MVQSKRSLNAGTGVWDCGERNNTPAVACGPATIDISVAKPSRQPKETSDTLQQIQADRELMKRAKENNIREAE